MKNGLNPQTGEFYAPVSGVYSFTFSGRSQDDGENYLIVVYKNNIVYLHIANRSYIWTMKLQAGDVVKLQSEWNGLGVSIHNWVFFTGQLLQAE